MPQTSPRQELIAILRLRLGQGTVRCELTNEQFDLAVDNALRRYRMRSSNATEESFFVMDLQPDVQVYTLPSEVMSVYEILRRNIGNNGTGSSVDPFQLAFTSNIYMAVNPGGLGGGAAGTLATYEFGMAYQKLIGRMFGADIQFTYNSSTKRLFLERKFYSQETVLLRVENSKPDDVLLRDTYATMWLQDYSLAGCKMMLGEARSKFTSGLGGPQGSITLNGAELKAEAQAEFTRLEEEIVKGIDGDTGYYFIFG